MAFPPRAAAIALFLCAAAAAQGAEIYCCTDPSTGRRACGDSLPDACRGRAYKVMDGSGNVMREVGPPMTAEQKAQAAAEALRRKEEEAARREQQRKDMALLDTYSSVRDIDEARARREADLQDAIRQAEGKITSIRQRRRKFENEAEFYRNRPLPPEVAKGLRETDSELKAYASLLEAKKADLETVHAKYDADKLRYIELSRGQTTAGTEVRPR